MLVDSGPPVQTFTIGGTVSGLAGTLVLHDNGGDALTVTADGMFTFATKLPRGTTYDVTVGTQPSGQFCIVFKGTGTANGNVTMVVVDCQTATNDPGILCAAGVSCTDGTQDCCFNRPQGTGTCEQIGATCTGGNLVRIQCSDAYDCGGGTNVCCAMVDQNNHNLMGASCKSAASMCAGGSNEIWCDPSAGAAACPSGKSCTGSTAATPSPGYKTCI
jgi:hypothetical protein